MWSRASWEYRCAPYGGWRPNSWPNSGRGVGSRRGYARLNAAGSTPALTCRAAARPRQRAKPKIHDFFNDKFGASRHSAWGAGPRRIQDGPRHHLADLAVKWRSLSQLPRIFVDFARGGGRAYPFRIQWY